jgi:apolipoprotein N-acyltransferase
VLTRLASTDKPDLIIWPETSVPGYLLEEQKLYDEITSLAQERKAALLVGAPIFDRDSGRSLNSAILFSKEGKVKQIHSKLHLVPFGEFVPFENILGFIRNNIVIGDFIPGRTYTLFPVKDNLNFSVLVCFEDIFPDLVRRFVKSGANFMVNITNDAWFKKTSAPYQHLQASVFRAVENRVNVVRAANTGYSGFIAPTGKIINRVHNKEEEIEIVGYASESLAISHKPTFYTRFGDVFALFCLALSCISLFIKKI